MTIFGTPGGTPLNTTPFQGTAPGNAVQAALQVVNPGVGLFPPNSNNSSGDTVMASASRAAVPLNVQITNVGATAALGRALHETLCDGDAVGTAASFVAVAGGSANNGPAGGNSLGAGGLNQTNSPSCGEGCIVPANAPAAFITVPAQPAFRG